MANVATNIHSYGDPTSEIYWAPVDTAFPTAPLPTAVGTGWNALGWLSDTGIQEIPAITETKKYAMQGSALVATLRSQAERSFNFECLEDNANVLDLTRPGSSVVTTAGVNKTLVKPFTSQDIRSWIIDLVTGSGVHRRFLIATGEAVLDSSGWTYKADDLTIYKFKLNCYPNPDTGEFYTELNDSDVLVAAP